MRFWVMGSVALSFAACTRLDPAGEIKVPPSEESPAARVRLVHLAAEAPAVDLVIEGATGEARAARRVPYLTATPASEVAAGPVSLALVAAGLAVESAVARSNATLLPGGSYSALALGSLSELSFELIDDEDGRAPDTRLRLRAVHAAAGLAAVDLWAEEAGVARRLVEGLAFRQAAPFVDLSPEALVLLVDADRDGAPDLRFALPRFSPGTRARAFVTVRSGSPILLVQAEDGPAIEVAAATGSVEPPPPAEAHVRVLHLSPDAPEVDLYANGRLRPLLAGLGFGRGTEPLTLAAGRYDLDVAPAGGEIGQAVLSLGVELTGGAGYTVVALGRLAALRALTLADAPAPADAVRLRAVHAADGVGAVDLYVLPESGAPELVWNDLAYGTAGADRLLPPGAPRLGVDVDGDGGPDLGFRLPALAAGQGINAFVVLADQLYLFVAKEDGSVQALAAEELGPAELRVIHLSPDAPAVDAYAGDLRAAQGLRFGEGSAYGAVPSGATRLAVTPAGAGLAAAVLEVQGVELRARRRYTLAAISSLATLGALLLTDDDQGLAPGAIRLRPVHAATGVGQVDVLSLSGGAASVVAEDLDFGATAAALDLPAGSYRLGLDLNDDHHPELSFTLPHLPAGTVGNVFASLGPSGVVHLLVQTEDGAITRVLPH